MPRGNVLILKMINDKQMQIILKWNPLSTQHLYWFFRNNFYMKKEWKETKKRYIREIQEQYNWWVIEWDIRIHIIFYFWDKRRRDLDNYLKIILDSMTWLVYNDDCQIQKLVLEKYICKETPRIEINFEK